MYQKALSAHGLLRALPAFQGRCGGRIARWCQSILTLFGVVIY
jgi:hypothetical protein